MRSRLILPLLLASLLLAACAPRMTPAQCVGADWRQIGLADGMEGRGLSTFQGHVDACARAGVVPDRAQWAAGREQGLTIYCSPALAYNHGRRGISFPKLCTGERKAPGMDEAWAFGRRYWDLGLEIDRIRANYRDDAEDGQLLPSQVALTPAELRRLRQEQLRYAYWPPR